MAWKKGPLPPDTYGWGGVVPWDLQGGFLFADFKGDHVEIYPDGRSLKPHEVSYFDNSIELPPGVTDRTGSGGINPTH